jgi:hypothetical protein
LGAGSSTTGDDNCRLYADGWTIQDGLPSTEDISASIGSNSPTIARSKPIEHLGGAFIPDRSSN